MHSLSVIELNTAQLPSIPTDQLKRMFVDGVKITAQYLTAMAMIWQELEKRGEDLADLRSSITDFLPGIANGTLLPDVVLRFAGQKKLLTAISLLPIDTQEKLVSGETITYVTDDGDVKEIFPQEIPAKSIEYVINNGEIFSKKQQIEMLHKRTKYKKRRGNPKIHIDVENDALIIAGMSIPRADIANALWLLANAKSK